MTGDLQIDYIIVQMSCGLYWDVFKKIIVILIIRIEKVECSEDQQDYEKENLTW